MIYQLKALNEQNNKNIVEFFLTLNGLVQFCIDKKLKVEEVTEISNEDFIKLEAK